jgi:hypothetical protein
MLGAGEAALFHHPVAAREHVAEGSGVHSRPSSTDSTVIVLGRDGSQTTISASAPGAITPLPGSSKIRAGAAQATSTSRSMGMGAPSAASVKPIGRRAAMPGRPVGILLKSPIVGSLSSRLMWQ